MEESKRRVYLQFGVLLLIGCFASQLFASSDPIFYESFDESYEGSWIVSEKEDYNAYKGIVKTASCSLEQSDLNLYIALFAHGFGEEWRGIGGNFMFGIEGFGGEGKGKEYNHVKYNSSPSLPLQNWETEGKGRSVWKHAKSEGHDDYGLLVSEKARKHAIVKELDEPVKLKDETIVLQFETRLQNGLECGGAYLKYLRPQEAGWTAKGFDNESPYSIMFGPDKCGGTNKVHFILKHKNPKSGEYVEHHLKYPPSVPSDKLTHVYTAILKPSNELRILIDGEEKKKANLLSSEDFEPALIPAKTIPDPDDKKPEDWDERAKIPDPDAVKPDDWDEDAQMEIEDEEAVKPEGWLDVEPEEIDDPEATKPEDWDEEEDGEWESPKIDNPKCETAPGCGDWKRPMKTNPAYKGKCLLLPLASRSGQCKTAILFDNVLIAGDETVAEVYRETAWKLKFEVEKEKQKAEEAAAGDTDGLKGYQKVVFDVLYQIADIPFLSGHKAKILDVIEKAEKQPNLTIGVIVSVVSSLS
ncbi:calnexin 1 [Actinidia rufa]|uniref:Calnexin 1 n=1 Tax=Actinidia rufa TaxID=165716 RepID=A0A7J0H2Q5_9ERIC|nr:calnexin 1 [Actinidia rufa]